MIDTIDPANDPPETVLNALVARCRVRGGFVLFVRYSAVACALALAIVAAMRIIRPDDGHGLPSIALAVFVSLACGAAAAWRRRPSARDVAARIDRHLQLEDTVVAAMQVQHSTAQIAAGVGPLIVRQAVARARDVDASVVFPLDLGRPAAALGVAAVLLFATTLPRNSAQGPSSAGRPASAGGGTSTAAPAPEGARGTTQPATRSDGATGGASVASPASQARSVAPDSPRSPGETASAVNDERPQGDDATQSAAGQSNDTAGGERGAPGRGATGATGSASKGPGSADASVRADSRGGGGTGAGGSRGAGSGGVRGGALLAPSDIATRAPSEQQPSARYEARRRAEAAVARGDIPPELRSYVREYFRAITR